ncbi:MAG: hypothetical protein DCC69_13340 [Hyphomicrobiales bacterium]|nr:MAG: hypothetical protein DCC69_13340 [Hyphomicrobiales bacterium]
MRHGWTLAGAAAFSALAAMPAAAQDVERYRLERTEGGYVRLDTRTGAMTLCRETDGRLSCAPAAQEREAGSEVEALRERVNALETRLAALESRAPAAGLPPEEEFERGMSYMERFFRMFMGLVREFEGESTRTAPDRPTPERT